MPVWRGEKRENQHLVWAVVVSLVLHAAIVAAVSLYIPAGSTSMVHYRQLITTLEFGEATTEPRQKAPAEADAGADSKPEPAPQIVKTEETTDPSDLPDSNALTERIEMPDPGQSTEDVDGESSRAGDIADDGSSRNAESAAAGVPGSVADTGRPPRIELPQPRGEISPKYPLQARRRGIEGVVVIRVTVSPSGSPVETSIVSPSAHAQLNEAAISAVRAARFQPGTIDESPSKMSLNIRIVFKIS